MAAFAVGADMRQEALDAVQHAHQVDVDHPAPVVERDMVDAAAGGDAGIVADHMDVAEPLERRLRGALDAFGIGDVADGAVDVGRDLAQAFDRRAKRICLDIGNHHLHAGLRERAGHRKPNSAGPAGHKGRLAGKLTHDRIPPRDFDFPTCMKPPRRIANFR